MEKSSRIPSLDGLRTISIVLVVANHVQMSYSQRLEDTYNLGNLGVRIFFVISGFLITGLLLKEINETGKIALLKFYFRRTLRIFVPFYFFLLIIFIATVLGWIPPISTENFLDTATYTSNYLGNEAWDITHSWSLAVEEQFYLIFPGILAFLGITRTRKVLLGVIIIAPVARLLYFTHYGETDFFWFTTAFHHNMDSLAIGCLLAFFQQKLHSNTHYQYFLKTKFALLFPIPIFILNNQENHPKFGVSIAITILIILIAMFIDWSIANYHTIFGKLLNSRPIILVGMMSYSIYLWQQPFFNPFNKAIFTIFPFNLAAMIVASTLSYYLIEKKSLQFRQYLEIKLFNREKSLIIPESA